MAINHNTKVTNKASSLLETLKKNSIIKKTELLSESDILKDQETATTKVPIINLAWQGTFDGGIGPGLTTIAGPSRHFKTSFGLVGVAAYLDKYPDAVCLFYNNEFGAKNTYFVQYGVDIERVIHVPFEDLEQLTSDLTNQLVNLPEGAKVIVFVDSIGNAASIKEINDALEEKGAADMTRAKKLKSLFRIVTPRLYMKKIPMICINHSYKTMELYSKDIVGGGTGIMYSSDTVWIIGKNQLKENEEITGSKFIIKIEKSRYVKEKSQFPITVRWGTGIAKWSGMDEIAEKLGLITKGRLGRSGAYLYESISKGQIGSKLTDIDSDDAFWETILEETDLKDQLEAAYKIGGSLEKLEFVPEDTEEN